MGLQEAGHEELRKMIDQLEQNLYNHIQWHNALIRTLVCKLPPDRHDIVPESYQECRFGQWYYEASQLFLEHPGFKALGEEHKLMHQLATRLLSNVEHISTHDYDSFANALERMRLEVSALIGEIENLLYNLDPLTGVINRVNMFPFLREQQAFAIRQKQSCYLIMIDLDNFKKINDDYGHIAGDKVLSACAKYISQRIRPYDKIFRYGGEEFLLCLPNISIQDALELVKRIMTGIAAMDILIPPDQLIHITASFGLTSLNLEFPIEKSIERADEALLVAKASGKNCIRIWEGEVVEAS